jgi:hypothetical protein
MVCRYGREGIINHAAFAQHCHCEERSDEAFQALTPNWIASLRSQ